MTLKSGLVSVTFRNLSVKKIIELVIEADLDGIEWGADVHVPHGDLRIAKETRRMTEDAGLSVAAYGSYYRFNGELEFGSVLETAIELDAPVIRVWAGTQGSQTTSAVVRNQIIEQSRQIADEAAKENIKIAFEYHENTLTDLVDSTLSLLTKIDHPNIYCYWQPLVSHSYAEQIRGLVEVKPWLANIHVYHWLSDRTRLPLLDGSSQWLEFIKQVKATPTDRYILLEFVQNDQIKQFMEDAVALKQLLVQA